MAALIQQRCFTHPGREAVSRCPECRRFFCRECVNEYEGRLLCAACLRKVLTPAAVTKRRSVVSGAIGQGLLGLLFAWFFYYSLGELLTLMPTQYHDSQEIKGAK
jgi:hypothetical protein